MREGRHITQAGADLQRETAQPVPRLMCIGTFPPARSRFARPPAQNRASFTRQYAAACPAVRLILPTQPFRPFWLMFWPQNLTGQLRTAPCQLPAFGAADPLFPIAAAPISAVSLPACPRNPSVFSEAAQEDDRRSNALVMAHGRKWAVYRQLRWFHGRSVAHRNNMYGTYLDAPRCPGKVRRNLAVRPKGAFRCANLSLPPSLQAPRPLPHAATPPANRRSMAQAPGLPVPPCSAAVWSPVPPLALQATSSTVRKTRAAAKGARGAELIRVPLTVSHDAGTPPPRMTSVRGGFACARPTSQHRPQGTAHV